MTIAALDLIGVTGLLGEVPSDSRIYWRSQSTQQEHRRMQPERLPVMAFAEELLLGKLAVTLVNVSATSQRLRAYDTLQPCSLEMLLIAGACAGCCFAGRCPAGRDKSGPVLSRLHLRSLQRPDSPEQRLTHLQHRNRF